MTPWLLPPRFGPRDDELAAGGACIGVLPFPTELVKGKTVEETLAIKNTDIVREFSLPPVQSCPMA